MSDEKQKKTAKYVLLIPLIGFVLLALILIVGSLVAPSRSEGDGWKVVSHQEYTRNGKKCMGYRVYVDHRAENSELKEIYEKVNSDSYYLHTVWFYLKESDADGSGSAWRTMEETSKGRTPSPE